MMMGSIELARTICEELKGELPDGEQYGSVDVAEILSAHVRNLEDHIVAIKAQRAEGVTQSPDGSLLPGLHAALHSLKLGGQVGSILIVEDLIRDVERVLRIEAERKAMNQQQGGKDG